MSSPSNYSSIVMKELRYVNKRKLAEKLASRNASSGNLPKSGRDGIENLTPASRQSGTNHENCLSGMGQGWEASLV